MQPTLQNGECGTVKPHVQAALPVHVCLDALD